MDIICRELRSGVITKAIQQYESDDDKNKIILVPLLADYLNTSENDQNKERINNLDDFGPIQSALGLYRADFDTIGADLKKYKAALPKATYSVEEFGMNPEATIRSVFCSLLAPNPDVNLFNQNTHKSQILSVLVIASSYLTDVIDIKELFIALAKLPTSQFYIECVCLAKPHWIKIAIDGLLQTNDLKENKIKSIICGIIKQSPQSAHNVQLICLRKMIHADLVINVLCLQSDRQFIKTFELIFLRKGKTLKWLTSQFSNSAVIDVKTVSLIRDKIISIMSSVASQLSDNDPPSITYAQSVLRVWCLLVNKCSVRFALAETSKVMSVFEETLKLEIREKSRQLITACVSVAVSYPEFSTPSKPEKNSNDIEPYARLATWLHKLVTLTKTELGDSQGVEKMRGDPTEISQLAEFFLILSIHFHFDNRGQLEAVISRELQMHTSIKQHTINRLRNLFMTRLYTQESLTKLALAVPPTQNLTSNEKGYIPLHAVTNLLEKREFTAHGIHTVRNWIFAQMKQCRIPFNQTVMTLIDNFIKTNVPESKKEFSQIQPAIDYNQIIEIACDRKSLLTVTVTCLLMS